MLLALIPCELLIVFNKFRLKLFEFSGPFSNSTNTYCFVFVILTFFYLCFGLSLFGLGEGLLLVSLTGASPWSVLAQGISMHVDYSIGLITFFISLFVIFLWIFLNQKPGIGTILNAVIIALMIDVSLTFIETPQNYIFQIKASQA